MGKNILKSNELVFELANHPIDGRPGDSEFPEPDKNTNNFQC